MRIEVDIPYTPRETQREIHSELTARRFVVLVAHRRMGKTVLSVNHLIRRALEENKPRGVYGYVAPFRNQAKSISWDYLKHYTARIPGRVVNEQELSIIFPTGAKIRVFGADNPDALRGHYFDGLVLDEVAQMRREVWEEILQPALADRKGWAVFIGTPKGVNLFHELYVAANSDESGQWKSMLYMVTDTDALDPAEIARLKSEMSENAFRQEFLCDFSASSDDVLIPVDLAVSATQSDVSEYDVRSMPLVVGVDVGRFGGDATAFFPRRGRMAFEPLVLTGLGNDEVVNRLVSWCHEHKPKMVFIDAGQGSGVIDFVKDFIPCREVPFGGKPMDPERYLNRRAEMWHLLREWMVAGGKIPNNPRLLKELSTPVYSFNAAGKIQLEPKEDIKKRLGFSPDLADALALTFALPMLPETAPRQLYADHSDDALKIYDDSPQRQEYADGLRSSFF
jgi:hypothetical protein